MSNYFLEHYGVIGMRWGKRKARGTIGLNPPPGSGSSSGSSSTGGQRHSNTGGSSGGSKRKSRPYVNAKWREVNDGPNPSSSNKKSKKTDTQEPRDTANPTPKPKSDKVDLGGVKTGLKDGKKIAEGGAKYLEKERKDRTTNNLKKQANEMSDTELREVINRLSMEQKYVSIMEKQGVSEAKSNLEKTLEVAGQVAGYADTALSVYDAIMRARGRI